jgi:hypothetical protein
MSFADLLRQSRSSASANLHKFLTNYDPSQPRVYAFVEGDADQAFYRSFISRWLSADERLYIINCEGKKNVYDAYAKTIQRYPGCRRVLFFVDKDVDDLLGHNWPQDPRIFATDWYSIENYLVCREVVERYFMDFVRLRRVALDLSLIIPEFEVQLAEFYKIMRPVMCWIIAMRRRGARIILGNIHPGDFVAWTSLQIDRKEGVKPEYFLKQAMQTPSISGVWRDVRRMCRDLGQMEPKRYIRGKFEAWFLVGFIKQTLLQLSMVADEAGGGISVSTPLHESNLAQLLVHAIPTPAALHRFLEFHLSSPPAGAVPLASVSAWNRFTTRVRSWINEISGKRE